MSKYLAERIKIIIPNFLKDDVSYSDIVRLNCDIHGEYELTVRQILYKTHVCPECRRLAKNKKLSDIGKTKVGNLNNFYGHTHSTKTRQKLSDAWKTDDAVIRKQKISNTVKSDKCQQQIKQTKLERYGDENYNNREKFKQTSLAKYNGIGAASDIIKTHMQETCIKRYNVKTFWKSEIFKEKSKQTMLDKYGVDNAYKRPENQRKARLAYTGHINKFEQQLIDILKDFEISVHNRNILDHAELDIYIPKLKLAIEYNGNYWHSYPRKDKNYHLDKSLLCREKGIRLIHIYEFEDFEEQKQLLKDLISGQDNYPKNDFNKNNLIGSIPSNSTFYNTIKGKVYTAGEII